MSLSSTVVVLNQWRRRMALEPISYGCLQRLVRSSAVIVLEKCETIKSGSKDEGTTWAWARYQFAQQLKRQFRKGARIAAGGPTYVAAEDGDDPAQAALELPIFRGGVVFGDEHHRKTKLGRATKYEVRIRRDATGKIAPPEKGGVLKAKNKRVTQKFHKEARGLFMVAEVKAKGTIVPDENFRTGRRARKMHGEGERKTKLRKCDRKSTHLLALPVHPALMGAYEDLLGPEGGGAAAEGPCVGFSKIQDFGLGGGTGGN